MQGKQVLQDLTTKDGRVHQPPIGIYDPEAACPEAARKFMLEKNRLMSACLRPQPRVALGRRYHAQTDAEERECRSGGSWEYHLGLRLSLFVLR